MVLSKFAHSKANLYSQKKKTDANTITIEKKLFEIFLVFIDVNFWNNVNQQHLIFSRSSTN